jgi:hypothetical protein
MESPDRGIGGGWRWFLWTGQLFALTSTAEPKHKEPKDTSSSPCHRFQPPLSFVFLDSAAAAFMITDETQRLLQASSAGALKDAEAFVRHCVRADGSVDGEDGDFFLPERQWSALIGWAGTCGKILPQSFAGPAREGGREHDVTLSEHTGRWIKFTKSSACGYTVSCNDAQTPYLLPFSRNNP